MRRFLYINEEANYMNYGSNQAPKAETSGKRMINWRYILTVLIFILPA